jgi:hypothetical protein
MTGMPRMCCNMFKNSMLCCFNEMANGLKHVIVRTVDQRNDAKTQRNWLWFPTVQLADMTALSGLREI